MILVADLLNGIAIEAVRLTKAQKEYIYIYTCGNCSSADIIYACNINFSNIYNEY